jgi:carboxymethylenebutenolidase
MGCAGWQRRRYVAAMQTRTVTVDVAGLSMPVYEAVPTEGRPRGGVVVVQEAFGVNEHIEDVARRFAQAGYHAVAPHFFHRAGGGSVPYEEVGSIMPMFEGVNDQTIVADFDAAKQLLNDAGIADEAVAVVGFCFGGRVSFLAALERRLGAAVGFYGSGIGRRSRLGHGALIERTPSLQTPWLGLFGDQDQAIPLDEVESIRAILDDDAPVDHDVIRYPGAGHGFHCDARAAYDPAAAEHAWERTLAWLDVHMAPVTD